MVPLHLYKYLQIPSKLIKMHWIQCWTRLGIVQFTLLMDQHVHGNYFIKYLSPNHASGGINENGWMNTKMEELVWHGESARCTTGINIWSEPFEIEHDKRKIAVLLLDFQGSFDEQTSMNLNAIIFATYATTISSQIDKQKEQVQQYSNTFQRLIVTLIFLIIHLVITVIQRSLLVLHLITNWRRSSRKSYKNIGELWWSFSVFDAWAGKTFTP